MNSVEPYLSGVGWGNRQQRFSDGDDIGTPVFGSEATNLDAVLCVLFYHDFFWQDVDRASMNRAILAALKPGGIYGIVDHSARSGDGDRVVKSLHRIEEHIVREEIEAAGFQLEREGSFLRNPLDDRTWNAAPSAAGTRRGTSDRFVLAFRKPG